MPWTCRISLSASIVLPRSIGPPLVASALDCISPGNWCKHMGGASGPRVPGGRVAPSMSCCPWEKPPKLDIVPLLAEPAKHQRSRKDRHVILSAVKDLPGHQA